MAVWMIPVAMAAAGAAKGHLDQKAAKKKREAEAEIARWSPWTGMSAQRVDDGPGVLGGAMQGGMSGLGMMQAAKMAGYGSDSGAASKGESIVSEPPPQPSSSSQGTVFPQQQPAYAMHGPQNPYMYQYPWMGMGMNQPSKLGIYS